MCWTTVDEGKGSCARCRMESQIVSGVGRSFTLLFTMILRVLKAEDSVKLRLRVEEGDEP